MLIIRTKNELYVFILAYTLSISDVCSKLYFDYGVFPLAHCM